MITSGALSARFRRGESWALEFVAGQKVLTVQPKQGHGPTGDRTGRPRCPRAAPPRRRRARVRPRRAVRPGGEERPDRRHLERRRRHQQRAGVQERAVLPHQRRLRGLRHHPGAVSFEVASEAVSRCSSGCPASGWSTWSSTDPRPRRSCASTPVAGPAGAAAAVVVRAVAEHVVHHLLRRGHGHQLRRRDGRPRPAPVGLPLRLLLDARVPLVRLHLGLPHLPRSRGHAAPAEGEGAAHLPLDQPLHRPALAAVRRRRGNAVTCSAYSTATCGRPTSGRPAWAIVDFTNPDACAWYADQLLALLDLGVDCFKTDEQYET